MCTENLSPYDMIRQRPVKGTKGHLLHRNIGFHVMYLQSISYLLMKHTITIFKMHLVARQVYILGSTEWVLGPSVFASGIGKSSWPLSGLYMMTCYGERQNIYLYVMTYVPIQYIKMPSYQYNDSHYIDKKVIQPSYLYNWKYYNCKMTPL